jgi:hypothetical protein
MPSPLGPLVLVAALVLQGGRVCAHAGEVAVLATLGDTSITQSEFEQYLRSGWAGACLAEVRTNAPARHQAMEAFFDLKVMAAKARRDGIERKPTFQMACQLMEMKLLVKAITDRDRAIMEVARSSNPTNTPGYLEAIKAEVGLKPTALATNDTPLVFTGVIATNAVLATLDGTPILESDFWWFLKDAFRPEQRPYVFGQPGARQRLLTSYLNMRALETKARKDGLDREAEFKDQRAVMHDKLLAEFLQERDQKMPWQLSGNESGNIAALRAYLDQLRSELQFKVVAVPPASNAVSRSTSVKR